MCAQPQPGAALSAEEQEALDARLWEAAEGGDAAAVGACVGAMLGALHGLEAFPVEWLGALEDAGALRSEAEALVDALGG